MGRTRKYNTEEERKAARREASRKWYVTHKEQTRKEKCERARQYYYSHKEQRLEYQREYERARRVLGYETLSAEDLEALSRMPTDMSERVIQQMDVDFTTEYRARVHALLEGHIPTADEIDEAFDIARSSSAANGKRGAVFELVIRKNILYELRMQQLKLYSQVPINNGTCRIDFVISKQICEDKRDVDVSEAIIISTKTSLNTQWREDMHLYHQCKAYIMVSLDDKCPTEAVPDNVYFCSPHYTESTNKNIINLNSLLRTVVEYLNPETTDTETTSQADEESSATI